MVKTPKFFSKKYKNVWYIHECVPRTTHLLCVHRLKEIRKLYWLVLHAGTKFLFDFFYAEPSSNVDMTSLTIDIKLDIVLSVY